MSVYQKHAGYDTRKKYAIKHRYNISTEQLENLVERSGGRCEICSTPLAFNTQARNKLFMIDHCHTSGQVRGLLCHPCNAAIGLFKDSIPNIENAARYLKKNGIQS